MKLNLTALEARILGALVEKELATPEYYPLTLKALTAACNQKSNRNPVMQLSAAEVERGLGILQHDKQLVSTYAGVGSRVVKYTHRLTEMLGLDSAELAILCELLLRGPQTPGELRGRASRMHPFASPAEVRKVLQDLAARAPDPYVLELPRSPGRKENRFAHLLGDGPVLEAPPDPQPKAAGSARPNPSAGQQKIRVLEERIRELEGQIAKLRKKE